MDYTDDSCMDNFSSNQFQRMIALYTEFRADGERDKIVIQNSAMVASNPEPTPPVPTPTPSAPAPTPVVIQNSGVTQPTPVNKPTPVVIQNSAAVVVQNSGVWQPSPSAPSPTPPSVPSGTCNRIENGQFCRRNVQCCSGNCTFRECVA
jgi:hypothetical protein